MDKFHSLGLLKANWTYDVPLKIREGEYPTPMSEAERDLWNRLTSKRIDAVGETVAEIYVCEIKDRLRPSAVGQALTYLVLYKEQFKPEKVVIPAIIAKYGDPDMQHVCDVYGIKTWLV